MIRIITDSLSDLTMAYAKEHDFDIMPLLVRFGQEEYKCGVDLSNEVFYEKLETSEEPPATAAVNPYEFEDIFKRYVEAGDDIVAIIFSKHMSATFQSASIAAEGIRSDKIHLIDCENGAMGQALLVETAVRLRDAGKNADEIETEIRNLIPKTKTYFVVDNMNYLHRSGRISETAAEVNETVSIHPVLYLKADGVNPVDKVRGRKSALTWLANVLKERPADENYTLVIGHSNALERAETLKSMVEDAGIKNNILITCIGPIVGTHIGPNSMGIGYIEA